MGINFGAITGPLTGGMIRAKMLELQQYMAQQRAVQAQEMDFARLRYQYGLEAPERERAEADRKRQAARQQLDYWHQLYRTPQAAYAALGEKYLQVTAGAGFGELPTRPGTIPIPAPSPAEGSLGRFIQPRGVQNIPTGKTELNIPGVQQRLTLGQYDPRFASTPYAATPVPMTADGDVDAAALARFSGLAGIRGPAAAESPQARRERVEREVRSLYEKVQTANTPEDARVASVNYNARLAEAKKAGVSLPFAPVNVAQAVADARKKAAGTAAEDRLTPSQLNSIWQQSLNQSAMEILGKRAGGFSMIINPDGSTSYQMGSGQAPLTDEEIARIEARARNIYNRRIALPRRGFTPPAPTKPAPATMTRNEVLRRQAAQPKPGQARPVPAGTVPLNAAQYAGQIVQGPNGKRYRSDGKQWFEVK